MVLMYNCYDGWNRWDVNWWENENTHKGHIFYLWFWILDFFVLNNFCLLFHARFVLFLLTLTRYKHISTLALTSLRHTKITSSLTTISLFYPQNSKNEIWFYHFRMIFLFLFAGLTFQHVINCGLKFEKMHMGWQIDLFYDVCGVFDWWKNW